MNDLNNNSSALSLTCIRQTHAMYNLMDIIALDKVNLLLF